MPALPHDADETLSEDTKRFIDRHVTTGEKRPPAPSVRSIRLLDLSRSRIVSEGGRSPRQHSARLRAVDAEPRARRYGRALPRPTRTSCGTGLDVTEAD
jgi:hypothetical protein